LADRARTVWQLKIGIEKTAEFGKVEVSQNDTVTFDSLDSARNPLEVLLVKLSDGTAMACTHAGGNNQATVTGAGNNVDCIYIALGYNT